VFENKAMQEEAMPISYKNKNELIGGFIVLQNK
jgi:hypothetical protein